MTTMNTLKIKKLHPDAIVPKYATPGAACFDLHAIDVAADDVGLPVDFAPGYSCRFRTGLAFEVPQGWVMLIFSRSGHGFKNNVRLSNCVGVIDSDYRGEVQVQLHNEGEEWFSVSKNDRIAQAMLVRADQWAFELSDDLSETERGEGGFGSTGA